MRIGIDIDGVYVAFGDYDSEASIYNGDVKDHFIYKNSKNIVIEHN